MYDAHALEDAAGAAACGLLFENMDVASVLDEILSKCVVRLRRAREGLNRSVVSEVADVTEDICGYMVKRISAHGGCLGGQRR
jgi:hypothetical protein